MNSELYKHYRFDSGFIEDNPEKVLAEIEKCLSELNEFFEAGKRMVFVRSPLLVSRETDFESDASLARVTCRLSFDIRQNFATSFSGLGSMVEANESVD